MLLDLRWFLRGFMWVCWVGDVLCASFVDLLIAAFDLRWLVWVVCLISRVAGLFTICLICVLYCYCLLGCGVCYSGCMFVCEPAALIMVADLCCFYYFNSVGCVFCMLLVFWCFNYLWFSCLVCCCIVLDTWLLILDFVCCFMRLLCVIALLFNFIWYLGLLCLFVVYL